MKICAIISKIKFEDLKSFRVFRKVKKLAQKLVKLILEKNSFDIDEIQQKFEKLKIKNKILKKSQ